MRLVAWNVNYNNKRRSFQETVALLAPLHADILVLSEAAPPSDEDSRKVQWIGDSVPGLVVVAREGFELTAHPANNGAPAIVGGFAVRGRVGFALLAAWPVKRQGGPTYHQILMTALRHFHELASGGIAILAGDLNTSSRVIEQHLTHPEFVAHAGSIGLVSAYHELAGEDHGRETVPTYIQIGTAREFHIDYCFVSRRLVEAAMVSVLRRGRWPAISDHFPVVVDIPDAAFAGTTL